MIINFSDKSTELFYKTQKSSKIPISIQRTAIRKLDYLKWAKNLNDFKIPPGNHLEALKGEREGFYSIRINKQFRIIFRFANGNAYDLKIEDYH